ncbi:hypothetical protein [Paracoccus sp. ME4]|uniref:hypothetical protein n=1 Tax=Paracoccus sp. ME4 TaxID=3138066 RepID=UPI00398A8708
MNRIGTTYSDGSAEDDRAMADAQSDFIIYGPNRKSSSSGSDGIPFGGIVIFGGLVWLYFNPSALVIIALIAVGGFFLLRSIKGSSGGGSYDPDYGMADMRRRAQEQMDQEQDDR